RGCRSYRRASTDAKKGLPFSGVFRVRDGVVFLVTAELAGPNGIALSPDERHLYVGNWDPDRKIVMRYTLDGAGSVTGGEEFFDMTGAEGEDAIDGTQSRHGRQRVRVRAVRHLAALAQRGAPGHPAATRERAQPRLGR